MIDGLRKLAARLERFDLEEEQFKIVDDKKDVIADLQAVQLSQGRGKNGLRMDAYSSLTIRYKKEFGKGLGAVTDRVTFFMTGELYQSLEGRLNKIANTYTTGSSLKTFVQERGNIASFETKFDKMVRRIGEADYGLEREKQLEFFNEITKPGVKRILFIKTGIKM